MYRSNGYAWRVSVQGCTPLLVAVGILLFCACGGGETPPLSQDKKLVVCTTGMIGDLVRHVAGDRAEVISLMGPGIDPHYYKATQGDLQILSRADVIFYNGLFLEGKLEDIFEKMARSKTVLPVSRDIPKDRLRKPAAGQGEYDPHIWFDVALWADTLPVVVETLSEMDAEGAPAFRANAEAYRKQLLDLHTWANAQIARIPSDQRVLITAHDAFGYFGLAYRIDVRGLQGISTVAEYGVNDVSRLVNFIVQRRVKAIFVESSVPERSIHAVREGCKAQEWNVAVGGALYSDAMGPAGSGADNYVGMVRSNVNTIVKALK